MDLLGQIYYINPSMLFIHIENSYLPKSRPIYIIGNKTNNRKIMYRQSLLALLKTYHCSSEEESAKQKIISFIATYENCFERSLDIGHITASAWLLNKDMSKVLLMHHRKLDMWVQLGGHCDGDSDVLHVALKEAQEESGIEKIKPISPNIFDIDVHLIPESKKEKAHYHYDIRFLLHAYANDQIVKNNESKELRWFSYNKPLPTKERSVLRMHEKWTTIISLKQNQITLIAHETDETLDPSIF